MSEQLTVLFEQLRGSRPPAPFAPPEQVRRRGRQRSHRQALAAGSAVLAVAGLGTGWTLGTAGEDPKPPTVSLVPPTSRQSPSASPTPTLGPPAVITDSRLLKPDAFTAISGVSSGEIDDGGSNGPDWPWLTVVSGCPDYRAEDYPTIAKRHDARHLAYSKGMWNAWEAVESYPDAVANLTDVRRAIATCPAFQYPGGVEIRQTVVAERFAGDDSLLVRVERASVDYMVVVRVGNLVATLMYPTGPEDDAKAIADAMAARLR
ncbi:hypothetical protein ACTMTJ_31170 [Phytohabitans sp. LJ34]|uniref:hypothetical protein n=1 Tax=Phytohabitans sp. LJ34 TaxID=3452217 RepID=UPI003F890F68